jgi:hypothetical protein
VRSAWRQRPVYDRNAPERTGPLVVNYDLDQLTVGENLVVTGRKDGSDLHDRDIAPGDGWCRAVYAPECAWPRGAHLCVLVEWHPDRVVGSDWDARLTTVTAGLRSLGYVVERAGRPVDPAQDLRATLLVYRMEPGRTPPDRPAGAWTHVPPRPRTFDWRNLTPAGQLRKMLQQFEAARYGRRLVVWDIEGALWPPEASVCARLRWQPTPGAVSPQIYDGLRRLASDLRRVGYRTQLQERPIPDAVEWVDVLVYREADPVILT